MNKKNCEKCGNTFHCKHSTDCWCSSYSIPEQLSSYLKKNYQDCLCKDCLINYIEKAKNNLPLE